MLLHLGDVTMYNVALGSHLSGFPKELRDDSQLLFTETIEYSSVEGGREREVGRWSDGQIGRASCRERV